MKKAYKRSKYIKAWNLQTQKVLVAIKRNIILYKVASKFILATGK